MDPDELDRMVIQVRELCTDQSLSDIRTDLKKTKSVEMTINRILDGSFLEGTEWDPTLRINHATIILDSDDDMEQPLSQKQQSLKQKSTPSSSVLTNTTIQRQISIDSSPDQPQRIKSITETATTQSLYHSNNNKDEDDDDNDSLPSLDALITQITHKETQPIDIIELDDTPPRNYTTLDRLDKKCDEEMDQEASSSSIATKTSKKRTYTPLELLDQEEHMLLSRKRKSSPSLDFLKEWESEAEEELLLSKNKNKGKGKGRQQPPKKNKTTLLSKKQKSPSVEIDFLKQWDSNSSNSSSSSNDDNEEEEDPVGSSSVRTDETAKEKRERLNKQKAEERKQKAEKRKEEQNAKKAERERAKQEKKVEKERKRLFDHVNRLRTNRQELLVEMILEVRPEFACSPRGELLKQVVKEKEADFRATDTGLHTITWRRKCTAAWDDEQGSFIPYADNQVRIIQEPYVLLFMDMQQLCKLLQGKDEEDMDTQIDRIQSRAGHDRKILLMIEGLESYYKKKTLLAQRDFNKAVLENLSQQQEQDAGGSRRKATTTSKSNDPIMEAARTGPTKADMEEKLTYLQMMKNVRLVPTTDQADSVDWIVALTADIANSIYKHRNTKFFRHQGPAKSGTNAADTWSKMLQEIQLCTPAVAEAITSEYPSLPSLHQAYERIGSDVRKKEELLADIEVERSVISQRDRTINKHMSKKIYTIFSSTDDEIHIA